MILGSAAIKNQQFLKEACSKFKNKIALGLDSKNGNLSVAGWKETLNIKGYIGLLLIVFAGFYTFIREKRKQVQVTLDKPLR